MQLHQQHLLLVIASTTGESTSILPDSLSHGLCAKLNSHALECVCHLKISESAMLLNCSYGDVVI